MKSTRLLLSSLLTLLLVAGCSDDTPTADESVADAKAATEAPDMAIEASAQALKNNDLNALVAVLVPPTQMDKMRQEFDEERKSRVITDEERAEFAQTMTKLTADGAEEQLMAEVEPQLEQMAAQLPMMFAIGQMMASQGIEQSQELTPDQKQTLQETANALFAKLQTANLADKELARKAIDITVKTARELDLESVDQVQALSFEQMLGKGGTVMGGVKEVLALYGFDMNQMLDSVNAEVVSEADDAATVTVSYDLFGTPMSTEAEMVEIDGRWYGAKLIEELNKPKEEMAEDAMLNVPAMEEPETVIAQPEMEAAEEEAVEAAEADDGSE